MKRLNKNDYSELRNKAYKAVERDTFSEDEEIAKEAEKAFRRFIKKTMKRKELEYYSNREEEYTFLNNNFEDGE